MSFDRPVETGVGRPTAAGAAEGGKAINALFAEPAFNSKKTWMDALEQAKEHKKWILVNIQQAEEFASHQLNRDVWSDDTVQSILDSNFLFWQRDDKSAEGNAFCQYYKCEHQLPNICIIDPRTGRNCKSWQGKQFAESHIAAEHLIGFMDRFSLEESSAVSPAVAPVPPAVAPTDGPGAQKDATRPPAAARNQSTGSGQGHVLGSGDKPATDDADEAGSAKRRKTESVTEEVATMPEEPAEGTAGIIKVSLRLPNGKRVAKRFLGANPLQEMFAVASASCEVPIGKIDLWLQFPKQHLRSLDRGLETPMSDAKVAGSMVLVTILNLP